MAAALPEHSAVLSSSTQASDIVAAPESRGYFNSVLATPPPLNAFDAFKKTNATYKEQTARGGVLTVLLALFIAALVWTELREYIYGEPGYQFSVARGIGHELQVNFDATVATPCHYLTVDIRDAVGDRLHVSDEFKKDGTTFEIGQAQRLQNLHEEVGMTASRMHIVEDGPACRIWGHVTVKKVTGNLHIVRQHETVVDLASQMIDQAVMNLSHVIHEFSFGPFFPQIAQPLDNSVETTNAPFHIFQYFLSVVSTTYIDAGRRILDTNQYSVTDMSRETEHGRGVPGTRSPVLVIAFLPVIAFLTSLRASRAGIFFKYDIEPMSLTIRERTTTLLQFLVRLAGIVGGILVCSDYGFRTLDSLFGRMLDDKSKPTLLVTSPAVGTKSPSTLRERAFSNAGRS
ncbi:BZ3500_MvSof-1268-A1-R1_Chr11-3g03503 [Microbotryum saponariae]|uniref:BZ3500_MvSof-1268-A1-R1_Chr11-3g03503 protein n=1 Tax=Microbotryum saponariae TaxID=289078 RepID=A0A2X0N874_9BASI|nr:BZ3500_MvSof-1268-A1-R1_Chr11-3g03503 [Microbotryum saponariae]SDA03512.1 BZ3501_MvSof-1269-A2-R1_Chr11g03080 [Microbotryum saponariae]